MKSLDTIQKTFRVFQILTKVAMILSFVFAGLAALGMLCALVWYGGGTVVGADREMLFSLTKTGALPEMIARLLIDVILTLTDGTLLALGYRYLKREQADGTPFTHRGANEILRLGIQTIVLPIVAMIVTAVLCAAFGLPLDAAGDWGNLSSLSLGIILILASLIFRYGAELEEKAQ